MRWRQRPLLTLKQELRMKQARWKAYYAEYPEPESE